MPRPKAKCGTYSAYKRHKRDGEEVDLKCIMARDQRTADQREARKAGRPAKTKTAPKPTKPKPSVDDFEGWEDFDQERREAIETPAPSKGREDRLRWQLGLLETTMAKVADEEPAKFAPLAKRHSELLEELDGLNDAEREADPFDEFFNGDLSNVVGFPAAQDRKTS